MTTEALAVAGGRPKRTPCTWVATEGPAATLRAPGKTFKVTAASPACFSSPGVDGVAVRADDHVDESRSLPALGLVGRVGVTKREPALCIPGFHAGCRRTASGIAGE